MVTDIDGSEVYVAVEAVQRQIAAGEVPGYSALLPEEASSLHGVLVRVEHYQRLLMKQALVEGDHHPEDVLRTAAEHRDEASYRRRLGLPAAPVRYGVLRRRTGTARTTGGIGRCPVTLPRRDRGRVPHAGRHDGRGARPAAAGGEPCA